MFEQEHSPFIQRFTFFFRAYGMFKTEWWGHFSRAEHKINTFKELSWGFKLYKHEMIQDYSILNSGGTDDK